MLAKSDSFRVTGCYNGSAFPYFNFSFLPPLASDFTVIYQLPTENCDLFFYRFELAADYSYDCQGILTYVNYKTEPFYASFTSGGEYVSFYDWDTWENLGDNISGLITESSNIIIGFDEPYLGTGDTYIVRQCKWGDIIKTDSSRLISALAAQVVVESWEDDIVISGGILEVDIQAKNSTGECDGFFSPPDATYNIEIISGNQYGNLINPVNNEKDQSITGLEQIDGFSYFYYTADGISADDTVEAVIRISTSDLNIPYTDFTVYIKPSPIYVYTVPEVLGADDTADVVIKHRLEDGTLEDFPTEQTFELAVLDGCVNGNFMVGDSINVYFADALQPIKFVTADSLDSEVGEVLIRVGTDLSGYSGYNQPIGGESTEKEEQRSEYENIQIGTKGKTLKVRREGFEKMIAERKAEAEAETKEGNTPPIEAPIVTQCALDEPSYYFNSYLNVFTGKSEVIIIRDIPPPYINNVYITEEPAMPEVIVKAKLNNYNKGQVKFRWAYWVTSDFPRRNRRKGGNYYNLCHRISQSVFLGYSYANNQDTTKWTVPFLKDSGYYYFKAIWYKGSTADHPAYGCDNFYREYEGGNEVFTGGEVSVKVIAYDSEDREIDSDSIWVGKLLGQNEDDIQVIYDYANENEIIAIIIHESRTEQFETTNNLYPMYEAGWPKYGYPNGYGLMQIDNTPAAVEEKLWNWKSNIDGGKNRFTTAKSEVQDYIDNNNATKVDSVFYMNAYQNYNSGIRRYWDWNKRKEIWKESEYKGDNPEYGRNVYNILKQLNQ